MNYHQMENIINIIHHLPQIRFNFLLCILFIIIRRSFFYKEKKNKINK
jgi:hypothetical protein